MKDKLSEVFDLVETNSEVLPAETKAVEIDATVSDDFEKSRENLYDLLTNGRSALMHALEVAKQSEHPRAFEVVGNLIKQLADINEQLLDLHTKKQKLDDPKGDKRKESPQTVNNNLYVGTTSDLNKLINDMKQES